ncbi:hypothetical protein HYG81_09110 [Natrinema zhouii]|uniref:Uncharacterized protein n=1 Tax=Natrinema zhouii TaxID=1710539 RepID=A0A7D6GRP2_9EURY|nr:hypothetical protein [Natrinema zhouii]QLK27741.1 hypothetical protein HYG81_09110 [Natrinema zhouii]
MAISRDETIELVGRPTLERAERERDVVTEDVDRGSTASTELERESSGSSSL